MAESKPKDPKALEAKYKKAIIKQMTTVGTYNESFLYPINVLARVMADYDITTETFKTSGSNIVVIHTNKNGSKNVVKNPIYLAIEKLRDDIINYSKELGLTPAGLKRINSDGPTQQKESKLEAFLNKAAKNASADPE